MDNKLFRTLGVVALTWGVMGGAMAQAESVAEAVEEQGTFNAEVNKDARYFIYLQSGSWCGYCRQLMPKVVEAYDEMKEAGVEVVLVSADKTKADSEKYLEQYKAEFPGVHADEVNLPGYKASSGVPWMRIVDAQGKLLADGVGSSVLEEWKDVISEAEESDGAADEKDGETCQGPDCDSGEDDELETYGDSETYDDFETYGAEEDDDEPETWGDTESYGNEDDDDEPETWGDEPTCEGPGCGTASGAPAAGAARGASTGSCSGSSCGSGAGAGAGAAGSVAEVLEGLNTFNAEPDTDAEYYVYLESASWCGACRSVMPKIVRAYPDMKEAGIEIILIGADSTPAQAKQYLERYNAEFPGVHNGDAGVKKLPGYTKASGIPTATFVTADGEVLERGHGSIIMDWKKITGQN